MQKTILKSILWALSLFVVVGCATAPRYDNDAQHISYVKITHHMTLSQVHKLIKQAGEEAGWRMTDFKENALIAENISDTSTDAVTINFSTDFFNLSPANSELKEAIEKKLNNNQQE